MSHVLIKKADQVLHIGFNRPDKKNALNFQMYRQLAEALEEVAQDPDLRAVLIRGEGKDFTAGNDLSDFARSPDHEHIRETVRFMTALMHCPLPVVAEVRGLAIGIGTTMLLHCDLVYCAADSRFSLPFINLALVPEYASSYLLPRLVGHRKAAEWLMLGEVFGADEALTFNLVNKMVPAEQLDELVAKTLSSLVAKPKQAMQLTKALMKSNGNDVTSHMHEELACFVKQLATPAAREAFAAFLEKRAPDSKIYQ
ncbi:enoyl-CoA hydratase [Bowmanella dokdonensis]|uniref:Enoyl-CoA hydratase n=1 Tax=Bowmanella dokdonensis TaxID=751969 RepID=A0A939IR20_9ALTE|nr:enoyl-CoA hydratase [Bowmanella dokdonensis]MBN7825182.1 enoyl-CoA hydratase [Bowmanella dokdonensis]